MPPEWPVRAASAMTILQAGHADPAVTLRVSAHATCSAEVAVFATAMSVAE